MAEGYVPNDAMAAEARRGLEWRREHNRGGTAVGVARARDIANKKALSRDTVARMASFFARHEVDKKGQGFSPDEDGYPSAGRIAWALWGGDAGKAWAQGHWEKIKASEAQADEMLALAKVYVAPHASVSPDGKPFKVDGYWRTGSAKKMKGAVKGPSVKPAPVTPQPSTGAADAILKKANIPADKLDPAAREAIAKYVERNGEDETQKKLMAFMAQYRGSKEADAKAAPTKPFKMDVKKKSPLKVNVIGRDGNKKLGVNVVQSLDQLSPEGKKAWDEYLKEKGTTDFGSAMRMLDDERAPYVKGAPQLTDGEKELITPEVADEHRGEVKKHKGKFGTAMRAVPGLLKTSVAILRSKDDPEGVEKVPLKTKAKLAVALAVALNPLDEVLGPIGPAIMVTSLGLGMAMVADDIGPDRLKAEWKGTPEGWDLVEKAMRQFSQIKARLSETLNEPPDSGKEVRAPQPQVPRLRMVPAALSNPLTPEET